MRKHSFVKIQLIKVAWIQRNQRHEHKHVLTEMVFLRLARDHVHQKTSKVAQGKKIRQRQNCVIEGD